MNPPTTVQSLNALLKAETATVLAALLPAILDRALS